MEEEIIKKKKTIFILALIGVALLSAGITYVLMTYVFDKKEEKKVYDVEVAKDPTTKDETTKDETEKEETKKDPVTDPVALNLYSYFDLETYKPSDFWEEISDMEVNKTINMSDMKSYIKNKLASEFVPKNLYSTIACSTEIEKLVLIDTTNNYACGEIQDDNTTHSKTTTKIDEIYIKEYVEKIFGPNSYTASGFGTYISGYGYYAPAKAYVYFEGIGGISGPRILTSLESAVKTSDTLTLNIKLYQEDSEIQDEADYGTYDFVYKLANNNYYLYSVKKVS